MHRRLTLLLIALATLAGAGDPARLAAQSSLVQASTLLQASSSQASDSQASSDDGVPLGALFGRLEQAVQASTPTAYLDLLTDAADADRAQRFASDEFRSGAIDAAIVERDRQPLPGARAGEGYRLIVDAFIKFGPRARVATWQLDVEKRGDEWRIADQEALSSFESLVRLELNPTQQFDVKDFKITSEDFELTLADGSIFTVDTEEGVTGLVLMGRGTMRFRPAPPIEKAQVKILCGSETLETRFDAVFIRTGNLAVHVDVSKLIARPVNPRAFRRAEQVFREESIKSYILDLADLTPETWSVLPGSDDFLAEIRTDRFGTLTYSRAMSEAEDISLFSRASKRNIAVYPSVEKLSARGRFYNEDDAAEYDVLDYNINVAFTPDREWIDGLAKLRLRIRSTATGQITLRLADALVVHSIISSRSGHLFNLRVKGQNSVLVDLPETLMPDTDETLTIAYSGRLEPQSSDRESIVLQPPNQNGFGRPDERPDSHDVVFPQAEPSFLYSNRSYWYPQPPITEYATATIHISVPAGMACIGSGEPASYSPTLIAARDQALSRKIYTFIASRPLRYLSFVVSRFTTVDHAAMQAGPSRDPLDLTVQANPRQLPQGRGLAARAADVAAFYQSIIGDMPYQSLAIALVENTLPGGHSPGYFAILDEPLPGTSLSWRDDPAAFGSYPEFFLAHEAAHQWWGQAVGWRNYHEQWLSEGFAQYFTALYAQHLRGDEVFASIMRQMRQWSIDDSDLGPVYLGYRVGHIRGDSRAFRAIVYNKSAMVLHMLRRLVGDDMFFDGLRRYYTDWRFRKASTDDFRLAMEAATGRPLDRFFERWIYDSTLPRLKFSHRIERSAEGQELVLHFDQLGDLFDVPVTVTLRYRDGQRVDVVVPVTERSVEQRVPLAGTLRSVDISKDDGTLAEISKN